MALNILSVGDILMLSQAAWKVGRAFAHGKKSAPAEFGEVEREANGLSEALKLVAETLYSDGSILDQADEETMLAVNTILESARRTLADLESFLERYQVIRKKETSAGFIVERSWVDVVLANYKTFKWTTEGGDITDLRNMLQMHTNSINLVMQALQSRSLSRLEQAVVPMAERIATIHDRVNGDLSDKIDDLHRLIMSIANQSPSLSAQDRQIEYHDASCHGSINNSSARNSASTASTIEHPPSSSPVNPRLLDFPVRTSSHNRLTAQPVRNFQEVPIVPAPLRPSYRVPRDSANSTLSVAGKRPSNPKDSAYYSSHAPSALDENEGRRIDWSFESGSPPGRASIADVHYEPGPVDSGYVGPEISPSDRTRRESTTLPNLFHALDIAVSNDNAHAGSSRVTPDVSASSPTSAGKSRQRRTSSTASSSLLGPPALGSEASDDTTTAATPASFFAMPKRSRGTNNFDNPRFPIRPTASSAKSIKSRPTSVVPGQSLDSKFEKQLFRNAAILCDVRGKIIEYAQTKPDEPDPRYNVEMIEAVQECRICVIRKRENREHIGTKVVTSIWTISDDGETRMQQRISDVNETVPYCSYFEPEKVSLQPTDGPELSLIFHSEQWGDHYQSEKKTNWVNYYFATESDAVAFQSAIFGRMLIGSYRTTKTTVIHPGIKGAFTLQEQFANIEMLRLWEDDGVSTPGAAGGVLALMHVSSNFGDGWARWWINNSEQSVEVSEDSSRHAKVKGIDVTVVRPGATAQLQQHDSDAAAGAALSTQRKELVKRVRGVRLEFKTEAERSEFVQTAQRAQQRRIPLPEF